MTTKFYIGADEYSGLSKVIEEAGEVIQVAGKLVGNGGEEMHWDGTNLRHRLTEEIADVYAALDFFLEHTNFDTREIERRRNSKLATFQKWHRIRAYSWGSLDTMALGYGPLQ